jgi:hypothetical protein
MTRHILCAGIDFDARYYSRIDNDFQKRGAILLCLANPVALRAPYAKSLNPITPLLP